jgi:uncharacterized protein
MLAADPLLDRMPSRLRAAAECALVVALLFVPSLARRAVVGDRPGLLVWGALALACVWALALTWPRPRAALAALLGVAAALGAASQASPGTSGLLGWLLVRSVGVLAVIAAFVDADGQSARHIGLERARLPRELLWGGPVLAATLVVHTAVTVPIALALSGTAFLKAETTQRLGALTGLMAEVPLWRFALSMVVLAAFEEVVFRGFLLPRLRHLTGRWWLAVLAAQGLFGIGHLYEGALAVIQTAVLGVCFSAAFLWRAHLGSAIAAHAAFNTLVFTLVAFLQRSGLLEKLRL